MAFNSPRSTNPKGEDRGDQCTRALRFVLKDRLPETTLGIITKKEVFHTEDSLFGITNSKACTLYHILPSKLEKEWEDEEIESLGNFSKGILKKELFGKLLAQKFGEILQEKEGNKKHLASSIP